MSGRPTAGQGEQWAGELEDVGNRLGPYFARSEPRPRALGCLRGLLRETERKNGWQRAEHLGDPTPDGVQHLRARAAGDADAVRDDLTRYVAGRLGQPDGVRVVDEPGFLKKGAPSAGVGRQYSGYSAGEASGRQLGHGKGGSEQVSPQSGRAEHLLPVHEEVEELVRRAFWSVEQWKTKWASDIRRRRRGYTFLTRADDDQVYDVAVKRLATTCLAEDMHTIALEYPEVKEELDRFKELNFAGEYFACPQLIDRERELRLLKLVNPISLPLLDPTKRKKPAHDGFE